MASDPDRSTSPHHRLHSVARLIRIGSIVLAVVIVSMACTIAYHRYRQRESVAAVQAVGGFVDFERAGPSWIRELLCKHASPLLDHVKRISIDDPELTNSDLRVLRGPLESFPRLKRMELAADEVTDEGLAYLTGLTTLEVLVVRCPHVTRSALVELQQSLPGLSIVIERGGATRYYSHPRL
jgi:hypothetical protein